MLPKGNTLPEEIWLRRHVWLTALLALEGVAMVAYALLSGYGFLHSLFEGGVLIAFAAAGWTVSAHRRLAGAVTSVGLITGSAVLIHISGGLIEAHFLFFVTIVVLTLYEDWIPFLFAAGYVLVHHGVLGLVDPSAIYNHPDAIAHPLKWALIHTTFIAMAGLAGVIAWRLNEEYRMRTELALREARASERSLVEAQALAKLGAFEWDLTGEGRNRWSEQLFRVFGLEPAEDPPDQDWYRERVPADDRQNLQVAIARAVQDRRAFSELFRYRHPDGSTRVLQMRGEAVFDDEDGRPLRLVGTSQDVTARERARSAAERRTESQRVVAELGTRALAVTDLNDLFSEALNLVTGALSVEMGAIGAWFEGSGEFVIVAETGMGDRVGSHHGVRDRARTAFSVIQPTVIDDWDSESRYGRPPLVSELGVRSSVSVPVPGRGGAFGVLAVFSLEPSAFDADDVSFVRSMANVLAAAIDRVQAEEEVRHRALHDPLTGLPNRVLFSDRLEQALAHAHRDGTTVGVLFCDLDQFKLVNDTLGHEAGDELLSEVAPRLRAALREGDTVARFGGDEFGVLVEGARSVRGVTRAAERIATALAPPFVVRGREHFISASIGIAIGNGEESGEALIRDADLAMYRAKERGRGRYEIFDQLMRSRAVDYLRTENELRQALERDELSVHYQPLVSLSTGEVAGFEALVRWEHPERGLIPPAEFIPVAEESELIIDIGDRVLEIACSDAARWHRESPDDRRVAVSVNISARQLADRSLPDRVRWALGRTGLDPGLLGLEVTETMLVDEHESPVERCNSLKLLGVGLALDDFGTGFSSLGYLQRLPIDVLKIDRTFVEGIGSDGATGAIVEGVIRIAEALGLRVVAEGIETEEQLRAVRDLGCHYAQGYLFARPMTAEAAAEFMRDGVSAVAAPMHDPPSAALQ